MCVAVLKNILIVWISENCVHQSYSVCNVILSKKKNQLVGPVT